MKKLIMIASVFVLITGLLLSGIAYGGDGDIPMPPIPISDEQISKNNEEKLSGEEVSKDGVSELDSAYDVSGIPFDDGKAKTTTTTKAITTTKAAVKKPKATAIKKLTKGRKSFKVTWKKVSGVSGYQVQYSTSKKFKKAKKYGTKSKTVKKAKSVKLTVKKLKAKKKYYVRVRTYKVVNGKKVYSSWSKVKAVKTK